MSVSESELIELAMPTPKSKAKSKFKSCSKSKSNLVWKPMGVEAGSDNGAGNCVQEDLGAWSSTGDVGALGSSCDAVLAPTSLQASQVEPSSAVDNVELTRIFSQEELNAHNRKCCLIHE